MEAGGMTTRDIQAQLQERYGVEVSPALISTVTEAMMEEVRQWQTRPLEAVYPIVSLDCLVVKEKREPARKPQSRLFGAGSHSQRE
jgi:transposase-like protein